MTSHLTLPYNWVDCTNTETCAEHIHLEDAADNLNSYPKQWVQALIGNCVITKHTIPTAIVETITTRDKNGELHSNTIPAIIRNRCHRSGNPDHSVEEWYQHGKRHRINGPAHYDSNGNTAWYVNGQYHRENGPAVEYRQGKKMWYVNGQLHRVDGPAVINPDGTTTWWMNGTKLTKPPTTETKHLTTT